MKRALLLSMWIAACAVSLVALAVPVREWKALLDGFSSGGRSWFFDLPKVRALWMGLVLLGPTALVAPWLWRAAGREAVPEPAGGRRLRWPDALLALALVALSLAHVERGAPISKDGKFYLSDSVEIAAAGGLAALPGRLLSGDYTEHNRHPFYAGALSTVAERSDRFVDRARLFSLAGSVAALLLLMRLCRSRWGEGAGLVAGLVFVTNGVVWQTAVNVGCESWFMVFVLLWFGFAARIPEEEGARAALGAGACAGLALLTKGTGTLLVLATAAFVLWSRRRRALAPLALTAGAFLLVALPLLVRNSRVFGSPFYNLNSTKVMWLDRWSQIDDHQAMAAAGPRHYWETHSPADIAVRIGLGCWKEAVHLFQVFSPVSPEAGLGLPLLLIALFCARRHLADPWHRLVILTGGLFYFAFAWYAQVVQGWRFLGSLVPLFLLPAAGLWPRLGLGEVGLARLRRSVAGCAGVLVAVGLLGGALSYRPGRFNPTEDTEAVHAFLLENVGERPYRHYLLGPTRSLSSDWDVRIRGHRHRFPPTEEGFEDLLASNEGVNIHYAVVGERDLVEPAGVERAWVRRGARGLEVDRPPPGWELVRRIPADEARVLIFQRRDARQASSMRGVSPSGVGRSQ